VDTEVMVVVIATEGPWVPTEELIIWVESIMEKVLSIFLSSYL
jgi:hypothetical protein